MKYTDNSALIEVIKNTFKSKGIKQQFIADKLGMSKSQLSQMLNGRKKLNFEDVNKILNCFDYEINFTFVPKSSTKE